MDSKNVIRRLRARFAANNHHRCDHQAGVCSHYDSMPRISVAEANLEVRAMIAESKREA